ncbi:MAG: hypothetical protein GEU26_15130 [Nitrososphaeraceae archaeon]|nr:hypothetical protein [Nitrososphaeraceae archaeon]
MKEDISHIASILNEIFQMVPFKRDYDTAFGRICNILLKYGINENPRNLRFRFILCMQEFFDSIPENKWKLKDPDFLKQADEAGISKFMEWIIEQVS